MEDLRRMAVFAAVVDAGSFSGAGRRLGLTTSAVSKHVAKLEARHGVRLLHRTTRRLALSDAGRTFHERCSALVTSAEAALAGLRELSVEPRGRLRISAPLGFADPFVAVPLANLLAEHTDLEAEVEVSDEIVDLVAEGIDVAIRAGRLEDSSLVARRIAPLGLVVCGSPDYLQRRGKPRVPADLLGHEWIDYSPLGTPQRLRFRGPGGRAQVRLKGRASTNNGPVLRTLLRAGLGLGLLPEFFVADDLATGRLARVLDDHDLPAGAVYAVHASGRHVPPKVRRFVDHLVAAHRV